jgi:uncharacterized repeat protein (TIGR02543 family)
VDGLPAADESARDNRSTRGTESCGVVESLLSLEIAQKVLGDVSLADEMEKIAYNTLPGAFSPDYSGHTYFQEDNQITRTKGNREYDNDHGDSTTYGAPSGFDCCFANVHMGWPKFVQNMWMATENNGLAIVAYGPNSVTARVADGKTAVFKQETDYPFKDTVQLTYQGDANVSFELKVRIPSWAVAPVVKVNGITQEGVAAGGYYTLTRTWQKGDVVEVNLPSEIKTVGGYNDSVSVVKGPLIFGLKIKEDWRIDNDNSTRELKVQPTEFSPTREVFAATPWNYGLVLNQANISDNFEIIYDDIIAEQPFAVEGAPITLRAIGQTIPNWTLAGNIVGAQPFGPTLPNTSLQAPIELIPYGSARIRISQFPKIGTPNEDGSIVKTTVNDSSIARDSLDRTKKYLEFDNIAVPKAVNYTLEINYTGTGTGKLKLNNKVDVSVAFDGSGKATVDNLKGRISDESFKFKDGQLNNLRFDIPTGVQITSIRVFPNDKEISAITIFNTLRNGDSFSISTNLNCQETPYEVMYGTNADNLTHTVRGFKSDTAIITGLDEQTDYYAKVKAMINGKIVESEVLSFPKKNSSNNGQLEPNPNAPNASFNDNFNGGSGYSENFWAKYGAAAKMNFDGAKYVFTADSRLKSVVKDSASNNWTDYVVSAKIAIKDSNPANNAGIMFRSSNIGDEPDAYNGYYVGIGKFSGQMGIMIGMADGSWHDIKKIPYSINVNQEYDLKIVVFNDQFAVYLDDEFIYKIKAGDIGDGSDQKIVPNFARGTVGLRSYNVSFTADDFVVRNIEQGDLKPFQPEIALPQELFSDDFDDAAYSANHWTEYDPNNAVSITTDGVYQFKTNTKQKAVVTTTDSALWVDFTAEADIVLSDSFINNAGIMFRASNIGNDPDAYNGYHVGIGDIAGDKGIMIGYADGGWHDIKKIPMAINLGQTYKLKVVVSGNKAGVYLDDIFISEFDTTLFTQGTVGLRSYRQAFTADDFRVRTSTQEELEDLGIGASEPERIEPATFTDDFTNGDNWLTSQGSSSIAAGELIVPSAGGTKVYLNNTDALLWNDYSYSADVTLTANGSNAGLMVRSSDEEGNSDSNSYYFGITPNNSYQIGHFDKAWHEITVGAADTGVSQTRNLEVRAYKNNLAFYIDGKKVYQMNNNSHDAGRVGVRTWHQAFKVDNVEVRPLTSGEKEELEAKPEFTGVKIAPIYDGFQVYFPEVGSAKSYKIKYGTEPENYTYEEVDIKLSGYAAGAITAGKSSVTGLDPDTTYYVVVIPMSGTTELSASEEIVITTGKENNIADQKAEMQIVLDSAKNSLGMDAASRARLNKAITYAESLTSENNQIEYELATQLLKVALDYEAKEYNVTFDTDGGTPVASQVTSQVLTVPETTKAGYIFKGWYNGAQLIEFPYTITEDITLKAAWDKQDEQPAIPVTSITLSGKDGVTSITTKGGALQMVVTVAPDSATNKAVTWSIVNGSSFAALSTEGVLTASANGTVTVKATSVSNKAVSDICEIIITGNPTSGEGESGGGGGSTPKPTPKPTPAPEGSTDTTGSLASPVMNIRISTTSGTASQNGTNIALSVQPYIEKGRTMAGLRDVANLLGIENRNVVWNGNDKTITITMNNRTVQLAVNQNYVIVNGEKIPLDVAPAVRNGRTVLPVAQIARILGIEIQFDINTKEVIFNKM